MDNNQIYIKIIIKVSFGRNLPMRKLSNPDFAYTPLLSECYKHLIE